MTNLQKLTDLLCESRRNKETLLKIFNFLNNLINNMKTIIIWDYIIRNDWKIKVDILKKKYNNPTNTSLGQSINWWWIRIFKK